MGFLGEGLEEIAAHKAGIIKKNAVVVSAKQEENVKMVLENTVVQKQAERIVFVDEEEIRNEKYDLHKTTFSYKDRKKIEITLLGTYQVKNASLALETADALKQMGYQIEEEKVRKALKETKWSARFQVISKKPLFLVDGAHNAAAAKELRKSIEFYFTNRRIIYIIGVFRDKEYPQVIRETCDLAEHIITVAKKGTTRALPSVELAGEVSRVNPMVTAADSVEEAVELAYLLADNDTVIIAFGSLAYLGDCIYAVEHHKDMGKDTHGQQR